MPLYKVLTGWRGNGREGVLVEASNEEEAGHTARKALIMDARISMSSAVGPTLIHHMERLNSYFDMTTTFQVQEVILPHIDEFS
jgi:nucleoside recognition membrane protein YjiH